jgi:hypothetical protein
MDKISESDIKSISFPEAIALTQSLMNEIVENKIAEADLEKIVSSLVSSKNGARGFFVAYLTGELPLADNPSVGIINALQKSSEIVSELLVKNLAMSSAMTISHLRNNDQDSATSSQTVCQRSANLIKLLNLKSIATGLQELKTTIDSGAGEYQDFLERWEYDTEQKDAIISSIDPLIR